MSLQNLTTHNRSLQKFKSKKAFIIALQNNSSLPLTEDLQLNILEEVREALFQKIQKSLVEPQLTCLNNFQMTTTINTLNLLANLTKQEGVQ